MIVWVVEYVTAEMKEKVSARGEKHVVLSDLLLLWIVWFHNQNLPAFTTFFSSIDRHFLGAFSM